MIGRKKELAVLQRMAGSRRFEFLVMYGRRRVGKTTILQEFAKGQPVIFFPAQEKNDALNLQDFSQSLQEYFADAFLAPFPDWERAFAYFGKQAASRPEKTVLIIDEFPFLAAQNASIKSILQHAIDHAWQQQNIMLVLCGSSVSFMVNDVMGYKSPLYGRITGQMEVLPFDYFDSASFFPHYSEEERLKAISDLGPDPEITRFKGLGEISPDEFAGFIGPDIRLEQVTLHKTDQVQKLLEYYMGKNTMERQLFIIDNLVIEEDRPEEEEE